MDEIFARLRVVVEAANVFPIALRFVAVDRMPTPMHGHHQLRHIELSRSGDKVEALLLQDVNAHTDGMRYDGFLDILAERSIGRGANHPVINKDFSS